MRSRGIYENEIHENYHDLLAGAVMWRLAVLLVPFALVAQIPKPGGASGATGATGSTGPAPCATANAVFYNSAASTPGCIPVVNSAVMVTSAGGVPTESANLPVANLPVGAIAANGPNVQYGYEVSGVNLLATGVTPIFTTATGLGSFRATTVQIEVTSATGSAATGTLVFKVGTVALSQFDICTNSVAASSFGWATGSIIAGAYISPPVGSTSGNYGVAIIPQTTSVGINITAAYATATTLVAKVRVWGFYQ